MRKQVAALEENEKILLNQSVSKRLGVLDVKGLGIMRMNVQKKELWL